jgi:hypothetical protein
MANGVGDADDVTAGETDSVYAPELASDAQHAKLYELLLSAYEEQEAVFRDS